MEEKLRPCPFCGAEAELVRNSSGIYFARCTNRQCAAKTRLYHENENGARLAWNRCAERTCRPVVADDGAGAWGVYCSECGYRFAGPHGKREVSEHMAARRDIMPRYCPYCGARVVGKQ